MKCPYCDSENFAKLTFENPDIKYQLTKVNVATKTVEVASGIPVDVYGCPDCKSILLKNENL